MTRFVGLAGRLNRLCASRIAGFAAVIIAVLGLVGWWAELPLLSSWGAGLAAMKPVTALCLAALGLALMYPGKDSRLAIAVGFTVLRTCSSAMNGMGSKSRTWFVLSSRISQASLVLALP